MSNRIHIASHMPASQVQPEFGLGQTLVIPGSSGAMIKLGNLRIAAEFDWAWPVAE